MRSINVYYKDFAGLSRFVAENHDWLFDPGQSALLVQVFSGCCEQAFFSRVLTEISRLIPHACIIGATTGGEIINGEISAASTVLSFAAFYHSTVRGGIFSSKGREDYKLGFSLAAALAGDKAKVLLLFASGVTINADELLRGIQTANPSLPVAGGSAGSHCTYRPDIVAYNGQVSASGVAGVVIEGEELTVNRFQLLGWQPIGKKMTITRAAGHRVFAIDNLPAYEVYRKYLGLGKEQAFKKAAEYPLMVERRGVQLARVPVAVYDDDSIYFAGELLQGEQVRLSFGNIGKIIDNINDLCGLIKQQNVESIFVYSCACRTYFLQGISKYETRPLQAIAPTAGFFTSGEFFYADRTNHLLNAAMTVLALAEKSDFPVCRAHAGASLDDGPPESVDIDPNDTMLENAGTLRALTHLINTVTTELEQAQERLKYNVIGEMAAALGHEVRNPLTTVRGYLQMFRQKERFADYWRQMDTMIEELDQANSIISEFLSLAKNKKIEMKRGNINDVLANLFPLLQADAFRRGHNLSMKTGIIPDIMFDHRELRQIIINLVHNGLEAMKKEGTVTIRTHAYQNELVLSVQDTGSGIPTDIIDKLGTPFVTTKDRGTGLGLSICYRIAERHGAKIKIKTGPKGTTVAVVFKLAREMA